MKFYFTLILLLVFLRFTKAQSDSVSLFHQSINTESQQQLGTFKNALNFNLMQVTRGGILIDYERLLGNSGLSIFGGLGFSKFDGLGQLYFREISFYYELGENTTKTSSDLRGVFDIGFKYYTQKVLGNSYLGLGFTTIANTVHTSFYQTDGAYYILPSTNQLDYRSNEFKILFGFANDGNKIFYHEFGIGLGFRFINYQRYDYRLYKSQNINQPNGKELFIKNSSNQTFWFFIYWKMGRRF